MKRMSVEDLATENILQRYTFLKELDENVDKHEAMIDKEKVDKEREDMVENFVNCTGEFKNEYNIVMEEDNVGQKPRGCC